MLNKFKRWMRNWLSDMQEEKISVVSNSSVDVRDYERFTREGIKFSVVPAQGGLIISVRTYNSFNDSYSDSLSVIQDTDDYRERLLDILSIELLKLK